MRITGGTTKEKRWAVEVGRQAKGAEQGNGEGGKAKETIRLTEGAGK